MYAQSEVQRMKVPADARHAACYRPDLQAAREIENAANYLASRKVALTILTDVYGTRVLPVRADNGAPLVKGFGETIATWEV